jgi:hypothetical protein
VLGADLDETRLELARAEAALENVADAVVAAGLASPAEVKQTIKELYAFAHAEGRQPLPMATTTLPFPLQSASSLIASAARSSGYVDDTCGRSFPSRHQPTSSSTF